MSEYLNKKAVLEWFGLMHLEYSHNAAVSEFIESGIEIFESGTFDATEVDSEIQRLREALDRIRRYEMMTKMKKTPVWKIADEALQAGERETDENLVGRTVKWTSQSQGVVKEKSGMVVAIVEPKEDLMPYLPPGLPSSRLKADRYSMSRRALVAVPRTSGNGCDYYAPPVKWLE
jgi:hypothetical protein